MPARDAFIKYGNEKDDINTGGIKMPSEIRARTKAGYRRRSAVIITFIALLACFSLVMVIFNLIKGGYLFSLAWFIAMVLAATYVFIRINAVYTTYISTDRTSLYLKNWNNDFLPYDYENKIKILSEFIPAKIKLVEIPLNEIQTILIGTKNFVKRNISKESEFIENIGKLEKSKDFYRKRTVSSMDIFYVETYDGECYYMPIVKFESNDVAKIVQAVMRKNPELIFKSSSRDYRRLLTRRA